MIQEKIIEKIKQIPNDKLEQLYNVIYCFRISLSQEKLPAIQAVDNISQRWQGRLKTNSQSQQNALEYLTRRYEL